VNLTLTDSAFLGAASGGITNDDFESYTNLALLNALSGGTRWNGNWVDASSPLGIHDYDDFESYSDTASLNALNGRVTGFPTAWVDATSTFNVATTNDDFESYADTNALNTLNGGTGWNAAWVDA
jgi:hypothetical protein